MTRVIILFYFSLSSLGKFIGEGSEILFWEECWEMNVALKNVFPRFYNSYLNKYVCEMREWRDGKWKWRRDLLEREKIMFIELIHVVKRCMLTQGSKDQWKWGANNENYIKWKWHTSH